MPASSTPTWPIADDPYVDDHSGRIWVHGDLHVENFGTYLNSNGRMVFDVNDFDEAYLGRYTWDLQRFAASLALTGWQKALPEEDVRRLIGKYVRSYLSQVDRYRHSEDRRLRAPPREHERADPRGAGQRPVPPPGGPARRDHGARGRDAHVPARLVGP